MEDRIDKPKTFTKEEEDNNENENSEAPPSIIQSTLDNQSQYSRDDHVPSLNFRSSELNIIPSINQEIQDNNNKLRSTPNNKEISNQNNQNAGQNNQEQLPQLNDYIKTPFFPQNENYEQSKSNKPKSNKSKSNGPKFN